MMPLELDEVDWYGDLKLINDYLDRLYRELQRGSDLSDGEVLAIARDNRKSAAVHSMINRSIEAEVARRTILTKLN